MVTVYIDRLVKLTIGFRLHHNLNGGQSQWPRVLRHASAAARLLGLRVRIPPGAWMSVSYECCVCVCVCVCVLSNRGLWDGRPLVQRSPTIWGTSEYDLESSTMRRTRPIRTVEPWNKIGDTLADKWLARLRDVQTARKLGRLLCLRMNGRMKVNGILQIQCLRSRCDLTWKLSKVRLYDAEV
jgi:hypothetical protein